MTVVIEVRAADEHLVDCHIVTCSTGRDAVRAAQEDLEWIAVADHADVFVDDGTGDLTTYYTTVRVGDHLYLTTERVA